ncbi:protein of unknown function [Pseudomonas mediterranea]
MSLEKRACSARDPCKILNSIKYLKHLFRCWPFSANALQCPLDEGYMAKCYVIYDEIRHKRSAYR